MRHRIFIMFAAWLGLCSFETRIPINGDFALYVATTGSDQNDCRSPETACLTVQATVGKLKEIYDFRSRQPIVKILDGVYPYAGPIQIHDKPVGWLLVIIEGNCEKPQNVVLRLDQSNSAVIEARDYGTALVRCLTVEAGPGVTNSSAFDASQFSTIDVGDVRIGSFTSALVARQHGNINCTADIEVIGSSFDQFFFAASNSTIVCGGNVKLLHSQPTAYRIAFYRAMMNSTVDAFPQFVPSGEEAATGPRCSVQDYSVLNTHGNQDNVPGDGKCKASDAKIY